MSPDPVVVIGAGPAGLTAAYELIEAGRTAVKIFDADAQVGGLSKTVVHNGNLSACYMPRKQSHSGKSVCLSDLNS